jgi:hypothetical protein
VAPRFRVVSVDLLERGVRLRMPFRFGVVTLTEAPQAFVRARIRVEGGKEAEGAAAELMVPKWFDKDPALTNEDNFNQLRGSLRAARDEYLAHGERSAWSHSSPGVGLVRNYGPALLDRALLDALCRCLNISFYEAVAKNAIGAEPDFSRLTPASSIAARHTVGLLDPIAGTGTLKDGLPETLEEVIERYGHRYFKLKVSGDTTADVERLAAIAAVLDRIPESYHATLDGNEQYDDIEGVAELWSRMKADARLSRLVASILFIEQPVKRQQALQRKVAGIERPVIIDESDESMDSFPRARALGYKGVSSKTCKGVYRALVNRLRCDEWSDGCFISGEDLTVQAGLSLQQDLALVALLGLAHVERNGHHYVNGMADLARGEQEDFLRAHPDLYEDSHGATRLKIRNGALALDSLGCAGYASAAMPDWNSMRAM